MAPAVFSPAPTSTGNYFPHGMLSNPRRTPGLGDSDVMSNGGTPRHMASRRVSSKKFNLTETSQLSSVVHSLKRRSGDELGAVTTTKLSNSTYNSILEWIYAQREIYYPTEGSNHDKVLSWAELFIERLHSFDVAIEDFAGDSYLAAQLAYGYCGILLELGRENAPALMISFGFFYSISVPLVNLLERAELFSASQEIREQLSLALSDLVTLVASVATHFHKAIRGLTTASVSVNIYTTFPGQIRTFRERCEKIAESIWRHQLLKENHDPERVSDVKAVKAWIAPEDRVLTNVANNASQLAQDREESTCLWVAPYTTRFLKSQLKTLSISGKPGVGKSVLASVIVDHLQRPIGGVTYNALYISINGRIAAETTPRAVVKAILCQLFEKRIGNVQVLQILYDAYEHARKTSDEKEYDNILWKALERALGSSLPGAKDLVIVVDGIDENSSGEAGFYKKLTAATGNGNNVKLITLGAERPASAPGLTSIHITEDMVFDDIAAVVRGHFEPSKAFSAMDELEQESAVTSITGASQGSILWAKLATKKVRHESSAEKLTKAVDALVKSNSTIFNFILHTVESPDVSEDAKLMLLWLITAERPLSLKELSALASVKLDKNTVVDQVVDVLPVLKPVSSIVFLQDGLVYLRHGLIRTALLDVFKQGKLIATIKDNHNDLVTRLLVYIKSTVNEQHEVSLSALDWHDANQLLNKFPLLDFAVRHWPLHLRKTSVFLKEGDAAAAKWVAKILPTSTTVLFLQSIMWESRPTPVRLAYQKTVTSVYRNLLTTKNVTTLQSIIFLALLYRQTDLPTEAASLFYEATTLSQTLLTTRHIVTMQMASIFLELTVSRVTSTKTEIMIRREEILLTLVECYKAHYGTTSENVVTVLEQLVEHYRLVKDEQKAQKIIIEIRTITSTGSGEVTREHDGKLDVEIVGWKRKGDTEVGIELLLDVEEHDELIEESGSYDFDALFKQAEKYVAEGRIELAERTYVDIWQRVSREYRAHYSEMWEERRLKAVIGYSKFLRSQKRETEASSVLISVWEEYKQTTMSATETTTALFREVAMVMKTVGLSTVALSVLKHCSQYYHSTNRTSSSSYKEIQESIKITSKEVMQSFSSSSTTVTSETTLEEMVYEASSSIATVDQTTFTATCSLISTYRSQHRWQDATRLIKKVLRGVWPSLFSPSVQDVTLPSKHVESCVELAERLGECYHARRRLTKEEDIRVRIYHAVRSGRKVEDILRERVTSELLAFFSRTTQVDMVILIRQEVLDDYTAHFGPEHPKVIKTLWDLAELTRPRPIFVEYYQKIIRAVNKESEISKPEAFEPLSIVATELWSKGLFSDALPYYKILFVTFLKQPKLSPKLGDQTFVRDVFTRYIHCLRNVRTEYTVIHNVSVEYQAQCKTVFTASATITIQATLNLAKVCQESKRYELEAITLYEELLKIKSEEIDHQEISTTLDSIYEEQAAIVASTTSTTVSSTQVERAVQVLRKRITSVRETHGWAHEESLSKLTELVTFHSKQEKTEIVVKELQEATINVVSTETSSTRLIAAASTIASSYISTNQVSKATELSEEIYRQIIMKDTTNVKTSSFDVTVRGRESLVFLAQFEHSLRRNSATITEILATLTTQYVYFEEFRGLIKSKTSAFSAVSVSAARLQHFLIISGRQTAAARVFDDFVHYFITTEGKRINLTQTSQVNVFLQTILQHFSTHKSREFIRSVGISGNYQVVKLLEEQKYDAACDLALACFTYISAYGDTYGKPEIAKLVLILGLAVAGRDLTPQPDKPTRRKLIVTSGVIIKDVLRVINELKINLAQLHPVHLSSLTAVLGEQQDYKTLAWLLTILWNNRQTTIRNWSPLAKYNLGQRYTLARYLVGDSMAALRIAEDITYNCRRVHGTRHSSTLEMSILLTKLYTGIAQRYQAQKNGQRMAERYYKKAAAVHENILRVFSDPAYAEMEGNHGLDSSFMSMDGGSNYNLDVNSPSTPGAGAMGMSMTMGDLPNESTMSDGEHVRQHLRLLKLALERLGAWPKEYSEYERLNADVFREYGDELKGVEGVEKWSLKSFGAGKAEGNEDLLEHEIRHWELIVDGEL